MYPSDVSDAEWDLLKPLLIFKRRGPKVPEVEVRKKLNGLLYLLKSGCQWLMLPKEYGHWSRVYAQMQRWRDAGLLESILSELNVKVRIAKGKEETPSLLIIDTQSVKTVQKGGLGAMTGIRK